QSEADFLIAASSTSSSSSTTSGSSTTSNTSGTAGATVSLVKPNNNALLGAGTRQTVSWQHTYGSSAPPFDVNFSPDGGGSWTRLAPAPGTTMTVTATTGTVDVILPTTVNQILPTTVTSNTRQFLSVTAGGS